MRIMRAGLLPAVFAVLALSPPASAQRTIELPRADRILPGQPAPVFTVGTDEGEDWELLSGVRSVAFDHADNLYVLDAGNFRVLVFDHRGEFVRQIGRQGEGPGELSAPTGIAITRDAKLAVADMGRRGYSLFERDGTFVRTVTSPDDRGWVVGSAGQSAIQADPAGWLIARSMPRLELGAESAPGPRGGSPIYRQPLEDNAETTTLFEFPMPEPRVQDASGGGQRRMRIAVMSAPTFSPAMLWGVLADGGVAVSHDDDYRIQLTDAQGNVSTVLQRPIAPREVTSKDQDQARERMRRMAESGQGAIRVTSVNGATTFGATGAGGADAAGAAREAMRAQAENMEFAETMPVISGMRTDITGRIWVQRENGDLFAPGPIDLIGPAGQYIGTITGQPLPDAVSRRGLAAYIERDEEYGIERVAVKRLPAGWGAPATR